MLFGDSISEHRPATNLLRLPGLLMPGEQGSGGSMPEQHQGEPEKAMSTLGRENSSSQEQLQRAVQRFVAPRDDVPDTEGTPTVRPRLMPPEDYRCSCPQYRTPLEALQQYMTGRTATCTCTSDIELCSFQCASSDTNEGRAPVNRSSLVTSTPGHSREQAQANRETGWPELQDGRSNATSWPDAAAILNFLVVDSDVEIFFYFLYFFCTLSYTVTYLFEHIEWYSVVLLLLVVLHRFAFFL